MKKMCSGLTGTGKLLRSMFLQSSRSDVNFTEHSPLVTQPYLHMSGLVSECSLNEAKALINNISCHMYLATSATYHVKALQFVNTANVLAITESGRLFFSLVKVFCTDM